LQGDFISSYILNKNFYPCPVKTEEELKRNGLGELINPALLFYLGEHATPLHHKIEAFEKMFAAAKTAEEKKLLEKYEDEYNFLSDEFDQCKAKHALKVAKDYLQTTHNTTIPDSDVFLIDNLADTCKYTAKLGYNAICVTDDLADAKCSRAQQVNAINTVFQILDSYMLVESKLAIEHPLKFVKANCRKWKKKIKEVIAQATASVQHTMFAVKPVAKAKRKIADIAPASSVSTNGPSF
jgi:hypothetical protein